jgi:hypothetical protein
MREPSTLRRTFVSLASVAVAVAIVVGPTSAAGRRTFEITFACTIASQFALTVEWEDQSAKDRALTLVPTFRGPGLRKADALATVLEPPGSVQTTGFRTLYLDPFSEVPDWDSWTAVHVTASGSFHAKTKTWSQPQDGWPECETG